MADKLPLSIDGLDLSERAPGHLLPPAAFTSPAVFEAELREIFDRSWVHIADLPDVADPGDFATAAIGRTPVVVVRGDDGELRGFLNACRHRGATLAEGRGNCGKQLSCPYHAWSYKTDGTLVGVPHREEFTCETKGMDLIPIRTSVIGPMIFGCLDEAAPPLADWAGELAQALDNAGATEWTHVYEKTYDVPVNWKVYVENGLEGYHLQFVHDILNDLVETGTATHYFEEHSSYTHAPVQPQFIPPEVPKEEAFVRFGHVFPNLIPVLTPSDFSYLRIDPIGPETIRLTGRGFDLGSAQMMPADFREAAFDRTNQQDIEVVKRVQRGLHARGLPAGVHSNKLECRIGHFERMVSRALTQRRALRSVG